jgi:hypothetical protein
MAKSRLENPTIKKSLGKSLSLNRENNDGINLFCAKSPVAPKITIIKGVMKEIIELNNKNRKSYFIT